jgi:uncharacterized protein with ParB-like and HNH nuclease domain
MSYITEKTIVELLKYSFFIPKYQRGYRWTERQVEDLLKDVWDFITKPGKKENEWYCLQPVVVKVINNHFEVLDGQQRLTTIFLILKHLERFIESEKKNFEIEYETRNTENLNSKEFLQNIHLKSEKESFENIDYYHIYKAHQLIKEWFQAKANQGHSSISSKFITPFLESSKVIWYEVSADKDEIEIFTRINMGKIPLTNAELIKALFLNSSNFLNTDAEEVRLRQLEIASEWDRIENSLQNNELWYFINNSENELPTRIEYLFNIIYSIAKESCVETKYRKEKRITLDEDIKKRKAEGNFTFDEKFGTDEYPVFRFFSEKFTTKTKDEIDDNWKEIKSMFQTIEEWFINRELYHKTGYLIATETKIIDLLKECKNKQKQKFRKLLDIKIGEKIQFEDLEKLEYPNNAKIKNILLFHNIRTMLSNTNETSRFPFNRYKLEKWDIEHIHAIATDVKVKKEDQKVWLEKNFVEDKEHQIKELNKKIADIKNDMFIDDEDFKSIIEYVLGEPDNSIQNLCLLDRRTNRSYKNDSFKEKRRKIIENEKQGTFIPICTKNIFMKYYSKELIDLELWNEYTDRKPYLNSINETLRSNSSYRLNQILVTCQNIKKYEN